MEIPSLVKLDGRRTTNGLLVVIAFFLGVLALRPLFEPRKASAQSGTLGAQISMVPEILSYNGNQLDSTKWTYGWVLLDQQSGNVWAYPYQGPNAFAAPTLVATLQQAGAPLQAPTNSPGQPQEMQKHLSSGR